MTIAYLNGDYLPLAQAHISPMDRGFLFGDGVYEVIPVYNQKPFRLEQHLDRLMRSLAAIQLDIKLDPSSFRKISLELIRLNGGKGGDQSIYLQCTRGPAPVRDHAFPEKITPTIFAYSMPLSSHSIEELSKGMSAITTPDIRWRRCDIKAITLLPNVLMRQYAIQSGAQEAILIRDGHALEGSAMNLFTVKNNVIITPPLSEHILGGITRDLVLELAQRHGFPYQETPIPETDLLHADEIWLTSSNREIVPVLKLNDKLINQGQPGRLWRKMAEHYQDFKRNFG